MWNWLKKAWATGKKVLGKVKGGLDTGLRLFQKGKDFYTGLKNTASNLPVVGAVASNLISKGEEAVSKFAKEKTGYDMSDVNKLAGLAKNVSNILPTG
jgi:hypothetical protein